MHVALSTAQQPADIAGELSKGVTEAPEAVFVFFAPDKDGRGIIHELRGKWPKAKIIGCTTSGEICTGKVSTNTTSAAMLGKRHVKRAAVALARFEGGVTEGIAHAVKDLETSLGQPLRTLDPKNHVGFILIDCVHGSEEHAHVQLGNHAPFLSFVGGSAGDNLQFKHTKLQAGEDQTSNGAALMVVQLNGPFEIVKLNHFEPTGKTATVTATQGRDLLELDNRPAAEVYAEKHGVPLEKLEFQHLWTGPSGLVIDGEAWVRQAIPHFRDGGTIHLGCELAVGSTLHFLKSKGNMVEHFRTEMQRVRQRLGGLSGVLMFDCGLRRMELEATGQLEAYAKEISFPAAGLNTHGESWLGHMHQTLTAVAFG